MGVGAGREKRNTASHVAWLKPQKYTYMNFSTGDDKGKLRAIHRFVTKIPRIYSSTHPKNLCYVFIMENNDGSQWGKSLGRTKGKVSLRQSEQPIQWKVKAKSAKYELKYQCLYSSTHPPETTTAALSYLCP